MTYLFDGHKLNWHPQAVADWMRGDLKAPLYIEVGPTARCNHRCYYCSFQFVDRQGPDIDASDLETALLEAAELGTRAVCFAGEGEPLLHRDIDRLCGFARHAGLDVALSTNGALFSHADAIMPHLSWVRFSVDTLRPESYRAIRGASARQTEIVRENVEAAVRVPNRGTVGVQALMLPENMDDLYRLAVWCRHVGVDYFTIKPFTPHPKSAGRHVDAVMSDELLLSLEALATDDFRVIYRGESVERVGEPIPYGSCLALDFWAYIDAAGDVYSCSAFLGDQDFVYGNIYKTGFADIWAGRHTVQSRIEGVAGCRRNCRMDSINRYLHGLLNPPQHINFI